MTKECMRLMNSLDGVSGVYGLYHVSENMRYIGSSINIKSRVRAMNYQNKIMSGMYVKDYRLELIERVDPEFLLEREEYHIIRLNTLFPNGFNFMLPKTNKRIMEVTNIFSREEIQQTLDSDKKHMTKMRKYFIDCTAEPKEYYRNEEARLPISKVHAHRKRKLGELNLQRKSNLKFEILKLPISNFGKNRTAWR